MVARTSGFVFAHIRALKGRDGLTLEFAGPPTRKSGDLCEARIEGQANRGALIERKGCVSDILDLSMTDNHVTIRGRAKRMASDDFGVGILTNQLDVLRR